MQESDAVLLCFAGWNSRYFRLGAGIHAASKHMCFLSCVPARSFTAGTASHVHMQGIRRPQGRLSNGPMLDCMLALPLLTASAALP